jgi:putative transposase
LGTITNPPHIWLSVTDYTPSVAYPLSVPTHPLRYYGSGDLHFITASCYRRQLFLGTALRRDLFLWVLERIRRRYRFAVLGYVIMPEHFHMLVTEPQRGTLSTVIQALKLGFSRRLLSPGRALQSPALWPSPRRIWQPRFYDFNVWTERKRIEKLRYMHRNPVKCGLVDAPEQWSWSSFRFYLYGERGLVEVNDTDILLMRIRARTR